MKSALIALMLLTSPIYGGSLSLDDTSRPSPPVVDPYSNTHQPSMASIETIKGFAESEFSDGNFGSASMLCQYLDSINVDDPKYQLMWATSQSRIGNWSKAERLYSRVIAHKKSTRKQKSIACISLARQKYSSTDKEHYASMALNYHNNDFVVDMVSQIYSDLQMEAEHKKDYEKATYYKKKSEEARGTNKRTSIKHKLRDVNAIKMGAF